MEHEGLVRRPEREEAPKDPDVPDPRFHLLEPDRAHRADREGQDLRVGGQGVPADDLRIELEELAVPALLGLLVPEHVPRRVDLDGLREAAKLVDVEPKDRRRELGSKGEVSSASVLESVELRDDAGSGLRREELEALEGRRGDLPKAERFGELDEPRLNEATLDRKSVV